MSATPQQNKLHVFLKAMEERKKKQKTNNPETNKQTTELKKQRRMKVNAASS